MSAEEILITYYGYTDTAYTSCGNVYCTEAILKAVGVPDSILEARGIDLDEEEIGSRTTITVTSLQEMDSCEYCAACGDFVQHGLRYPGEDIGCTHERDEWGNVIDPPHHGKPHIDLASHPFMRKFASE